MTNCVILGVGKIGIALNSILNKSRINADLWDKDPTRVVSQKPLSEIIPTASVIFLCTPSWTAREGILEILPFLQPNNIIVTLTKGIEQETNLTIDQLLNNLLPKDHPFIVMSGPMLSDELQQNMPSSAIAATKELKNFLIIKEIFADTALSLTYSPDTHGTAVNGVLKNVYAVLLGALQGLQVGNNQQGMIVTEIITEMAKITEKLDGDPQTTFSVAGIGDLITTGFSMKSRNYQSGFELATTGKTKIKSEGLSSLPQLITLLKNNLDNFPLLQHTYNLTSGKNLRFIISDIVK